MSFNKIILVGNLGRDPELKYTAQGTPVCSFSIATNEKRKDKAGELQDLTTWFRVSVWGKQAETCSQYLAKGRSVYVEGRLREDEYTDRDGKLRHTLEVHASDVQFLGGRGGGGAGDEGSTNTRYAAEGGADRSGGHSPAKGQAEMGGGVDDDDIPF